MPAPSLGGPCQRLAPAADSRPTKPAPAELEGRADTRGRVRTSFPNMGFPISGFLKAAERFSSVSARTAPRLLAHLRSCA